MDLREHCEIVEGKEARTNGWCHHRRILFFPYGNNVDFASFYLEQAHETKEPEDWYSCIQFGIVLYNPKDPTVFDQHSKQAPSRLFTGSSQTEDRPAAPIG